MYVGGKNITGFVALESFAAGVAKTTKGALPLVTVHLRAPNTSSTVQQVSAGEGGAKLVAWHACNESAVFQLPPGVGRSNFSFSASLAPA